MASQNHSHCLQYHAAKCMIRIPFPRFPQYCPLDSVAHVLLRKFSSHLSESKVGLSTPLACALAGDKQPRVVQELLNLGASSSIFVKGYSPDSLVCTLPMAQQPLSSVVKHAQPKMDTDKTVLPFIVLTQVIRLTQILRAHPGTPCSPRYSVLTQVLRALSGTL